MTEPKHTLETLNDLLKRRRAEDADFILRAVNSHKDLVDALKVVTDRLARYAKVEDMTWVGGARDVIDRAEGRTA